MAFISAWSCVHCCSVVEVAVFSVFTSCATFLFGTLSQPNAKMMKLDTMIEVLV